MNERIERDALGDVRVPAETLRVAAIERGLRSDERFSQWVRAEDMVGRPGRSSG